MWRDDRGASCGLSSRASPPERALPALCPLQRRPFGNAGCSSWTGNSVLGGGYGPGVATGLASLTATTTNFTNYASDS
jgi:hypothetical protein